MQYKSPLILSTNARLRGFALPGTCIFVYIGKLSRFSFNLLFLLLQSKFHGRCVMRPNFVYGSAKLNEERSLGSRSRLLISRCAEIFHLHISRAKDLLHFKLHRSKWRIFSLANRRQTRKQTRQINRFHHYITFSRDFHQGHRATLVIKQSTARTPSDAQNALFQKIAKFGGQFHEALKYEAPLNLALAVAIALTHTRPDTG